MLPNKVSSKPLLIALGILCLLFWFLGFLCAGYWLLCRHRGEPVVPEAANIVPVILYKDALAFIHVVKFKVVPAAGCGFLAVALGLTTFVSLQVWRWLRASSTGSTV